MVHKCWSVKGDMNMMHDIYNINPLAYYFL